jgi:hypothetical protein
MLKQFVTLALIGGVRMNMKNLDTLLIETGILRDNDMRVQKRRKQEDEEEDTPKTTGIRGSTSRNAHVDDDDDWD